MSRLTTPWSLGDAVGALRDAQPEDGHVEHGRVAAVVGLGAEREEPVQRHTGRGEVAAEVDLDEAALEAVDARGHRRVRREHGGGADGLEGLVEGEPGAGDEAR